MKSKPNLIKATVPCLDQKRLKPAPVILMLFVLLGLPAFAQLNPNSPTTTWVPIIYGNDSFPDPKADQQTGSGEADIVGNLGQPSLFMQYNSGNLGFRLRVGADANPPGFKGAAFIGLDATLDGALDLFVGVDNHGSKNELGIWYAGNGQNTSPSTTTIASSAVKTYQETSINYSFAPVNETIEPGGISFDLNGDGKTDRFLTFYVPFADMAAALAANGINFSTTSIMILVAATATQPNSLNQDFNGVNGSDNSSQTWSQLGASSQPYTPLSIAPVPEPATLTLCLIAATLLPLHFIRRKKHH